MDLCEMISGSAKMNLSSLNAILTAGHPIRDTLFLLVVISLFFIAGCNDAAEKISTRSVQGNNWDEMKWDEGKLE